MSIDQLHEKIRKTKTPIVLDLGFDTGCVPPSLLETCPDKQAAFFRYCEELLTALKGSVPAIRFSFAGFCLLGEQGQSQLKRLSFLAKSLGYYVFLDAPDVSSPQMASFLAESASSDALFTCDGLVISAYIGSDAVKPFLPFCRSGKNLFVTVRSSNKSASEIQDLLSGTRHVHNVSAETAARMGESMVGKCGFSQIGGTVAAGFPEYVKALRAKHQKLFFLVDGLDLPSGNSRSCSYAFDRFGYGAIVSVSSITSAWKEEPVAGDYISRAMEEVERIKRNLNRYVTIL